MISSIVIFITVAILCVSLRAAMPKPRCDIDVMVEALRQTENWDGHSRGAAGERGPWQITPAVWKRYSNLPFGCADGHSNADKTEQRRVAREFVYAIMHRLSLANRDRDAFTVATVWAAGWDCYFYWTPHKPSKAKFAYARRAEALYGEIAVEAVIQSPR